MYLFLSRTSCASYYFLLHFFILLLVHLTMENHLFALTVLPLIPNLDYLFILFPLRFRPHAFATRPTLDIILQHEKIPILIGIFIFIPVYYLI